MNARKKAYKKTLISFKVRVRRYKAVSFLNKGELSVGGDTMLSRVADENGGIIGEEDGDYILNRQHLLPKKLRLYLLVTNWHLSGNLYDIKCLSFSREIGLWFSHWYSLESRWNGGCLVICRCS